MKSLSERIEKILKERPELDQVSLGKLAGASKSVVNQWLDGKIKSMRLDYALNIEKTIGYNHIWLVLGEGEVFPTSRPWPFSVNIELFLSIPDQEQRRIDEYIDFYVNKWHSTHQSKTNKSAA
jgi:hypothetical protein